jgi:exopolyphosphatase/guanosine-5'-triphosphate,3'-diphosphate pyrophosphatase
MRSSSSKFIASLLFILLFSGCSITQISKSSAPTEKVKCDTVRAAIDIGSGSTRLKVAKVDRCKNKALEVLLEREEKVDYKEDLTKSHRNSFSDEIMATGLATLRTLKTEAEKFSPKEYVAVATAAFREAKNGQKFIEKINVELWINARIITQGEEALLGFYGSADNIGSTPENTVIWDIGGSSQQIIRYTGHNHFSVYEGKLGSIPFKEYILKRIKRKHAFSPNPINSYQAKLAVEYAKRNAEKTVKKDIKEFLQNTKDVKILGIGGVHYFSIRNQIDPSGEKDSYTIGDVEKTLNSKLGKTDNELGNPQYVQTDVSNLALVFGYMKALNIYEVKTAKINMTDGLILNDKYWAP